METRSMEIKIASARDLANVNFLMKMDVFTVLKLIDDSDSKIKQKFKTPVDKEGGSNPNWNFTVKFTVDEIAARLNRLTLVFTLRCLRNLGDRDIGQVYVPIKELLDSAPAGDSMKHLSYQVTKLSGNPQGVLNFSYRFEDKSSPSPLPEVLPPVSAYPALPPEFFKPVAAPEVFPPVSTYPALAPEVFKPVAASEVSTPASAYPAPATAASSSVNYGGVYPPPPVVPEVYPPPSNLYPVPPPKAVAPDFVTGYSVYPQAAPSYSAYTPVPEYGYRHQPPPAAYGYPPPTYGYPPPPQGVYGNYPPPSQTQNKKNMGLGMGAGLVGGMIGGLLIGDLVSDVADSGGFDF